MASGATLFSATARGAELPAANYARFSTTNVQVGLNFDPNANQTGYVPGVLSRNYGGGGITATIFYIMASATAGNVVWGLAFERHQDGVDNLTADSFAAERTVTSGVPATAGIIKYATIAFTNGAQIDSLAVGESFRLKLRRVADDAGDTAVGDATLIRLELKET